MFMARQKNGLLAGFIGALLPLVASAGPPSGSRQAEYLDRGVLAVPSEGGVFVSWRLLGPESYGTGFNVYRDGRKINRRPLSDTTNLLDPEGLPGSIYTVRRADDSRRDSFGDAGRGRGCSSHGADWGGRHKGCEGDSAVAWDGAY